MGRALPALTKIGLPEVEMSGKNRNREGGRQPEALSSLAASARNGGNRPPDIDRPHESEGRALPTDPKAKEKAARLVLREGVFGRSQHAADAIEALPDRTRRSDDGSDQR
jgi:hypothetical protein